MWRKIEGKVERSSERDMTLPEDFEIRPTNYEFSKPVYIRRWAGGKGFISVQVGYVSKHPEKNCIYLTKHWVGEGGIFKQTNFYIRDINDWKNIRTSVEKLWPELKHIVTTEEIDRAIEKISRETKLLELIAKYPSLLENLPKDVNILSLPQEQKDAFKKLLSAGGQIANLVISKLAEQPIKDLNDFVKLLEELQLSTINSLVTFITSRLKFIDMFEKIINNEEAFERKGGSSVHGLLKANIWIVDRNYSILHDDVTLKNIIWSLWQQKYEGDKKRKRPDFLCMLHRYSPGIIKQLVLIEIKRPSIKLKFAHLEQVMQYFEVLQNHSGRGIEEMKSYLIGKEAEAILKDEKIRPPNIIVKTYTDFIGEARDFYREYLEIIKKEKFSV